MNVIRIALVGAGAWGRNLLRNTVANESAKLVGVFDPDPSAQRVASKLPDVRLYERFDEILDDPAVDAAIIASPAPLHFDQASAAINAGLDVLVEKPMAMTTRDAEALVALAWRRERVLMVGHTFLYSNLVHEVKRRITSGELGDVLYLYSQRLNLGRVRHDVDALWNFAPHDISITAFLLDAWPVRVSARGASFLQKRTNIADVAFFQMDFDQDRVMAGHVSWLDPQKVRRMVVVGTEKMLVYDDIDSLRHIQIYDKSVALDFQAGADNFSDFRTRTRAGDLAVPNIRLVEPLSVELDHFIECVCQRTAPRTDGAHGLRVVSILEAMSRSMESDGQAVHVDLSDPVILAHRSMPVEKPSRRAGDFVEQPAAAKPADFVADQAR